MKKSILLNNQSVKNVNETSNNNLNNTIIFETHEKIDKNIEYPFEKHPFAFAESIHRGEADCEMKMFSSEVNTHGKTINKVIEANAYKSNLFWITLKKSLDEARQQGRNCDAKFSLAITIKVF